MSLNNLIRILQAPYRDQNSQLYVLHSDALVNGAEFLKVNGVEAKVLRIFVVKLRYGDIVKILLDIICMSSVSSSFCLVQKRISRNCLEYKR